MARSIETIYNLIIAEKEATPELSGLTSTSATSVFGLWAWVTAAVIFTLEALFDLFKTELETLLLTLKPGTLPWYQEACKKFQYGDELVWSDSGYGYAVINDAKKIVSQCSVTEGNGGLSVKIAAVSAGALEPLTADQLAAFTAYIQAIKYAGTRVSIINSPANKLHIDADVYFDPLVLKADGTSILDGSRPVDLAISAFLAILPFNGRIRKTALSAAILAVDGVVDVKFTTLAHKYGNNAYQDIDVSALPESGYFKIDTAYPLTTTLTYTAGNV